RTAVIRRKRVLDPDRRLEPKRGGDQEFVVEVLGGGELIEARMGGAVERQGGWVHAHIRRESEELVRRLVEIEKIVLQQEVGGEAAIEIGRIDARAGAGQRGFDVAEAIL